MKSAATLTVQQPPRPLATLGAEIDREHAACEAAVRSALRHARKCGEALLEAKEAVPHGKSEGWIICNCQVSPRQ
jgi:hypothetical protein